MTNKNLSSILNGIKQEDIENSNNISKINDIITDYKDRVYINKEDAIMCLKYLLYIAYIDILDKRIFKLLELFDNSSVVKELHNNELLNIAEKQGKITMFKQKCRDLLALRKESYKVTNKRKELSVDVVKDILDELDIHVANNLITKKTEITGNGADKHIYSKYSKANAETILVYLIQTECKARYIKGTIGASGLTCIENLLFIIADENRYNPVLNMFIENDNENEENLNKVMSVLNLKTDLEKTLFTKWLIQTVAIAHNNDMEELASAEGVLTLRGEQAAGKTSFCRKLAIKPEWFVEGAVLDLNNKDSIITVLSGFITELGEIDATFKKKQSQLKAFFTRTLDRIRFPFGRRDTIMPRTTSFCATVNPELFLKDETGNRRYWIIEVTNIDKTAMFKLKTSEIKAMWGYAYNLYKKDPSSYRLTPEELNDLNNQNITFMEKYQYEDEVRELFDLSIPTDKWVWYSPTKISQVIQYKNANAEKVGRILSKMEKEDLRIKKRRLTNCVQYLLPPIDNYLHNSF